MMFRPSDWRYIERLFVALIVAVVVVTTLITVAVMRMVVGL